VLRLRSGIEEHVAHSRARLVDRNRHKVNVSTMGFSMRDRVELIRLTETSAEKAFARAPASPTRRTHLVFPPWNYTVPPKLGQLPSRLNSGGPKWRES
jgi:hypothetical protein